MFSMKDLFGPEMLAGGMTAHILGEALGGNIHSECIICHQEGDAGDICQGCGRCDTCHGISPTDEQKLAYRVRYAPAIAKIYLGFVALSVVQPRADIIVFASRIMTEELDDDSSNEFIKLVLESGNGSEDAPGAYDGFLDSLFEEEK